MLSGKKIILGVSASIAAYKAAVLVRLLVKAGAEVQVILTPAAKDFITPLTLATLAKKPALCYFVKNNEGEWQNHVELGLWADALLIAPSSANTLAKCAQGICDNLLIATYLSARCPVFFAPAMDLDMYQHPSTQHNLETLKSYGNHIIEAESGELASGLSGQGRLAEPEHILEILEDFFSPKPLALKGKTVLITAGASREAIDPVRFISNHSTGKMGYAIAEVAAQLGAKVHLVKAAVQVSAKHPNIIEHEGLSAEAMYQQCARLFPQCDIAIFAAAVADYTPSQVATHKIKKENQADGLLTIALKPTRDIALSLGKTKKKGQITVGFALETEQEMENAQRKLQKKNFDFIVLNSLKDKGAGFAHDTNQVSILGIDGSVKKTGLKSKIKIAEDIIEVILKPK